jgi:hypothetical protein
MTDSASYDDKARDSLEAIRERNEQYIARAKLTEWTVEHEPPGDVRRLLSALGEALDAHPVSVAADGEQHCPRCAWTIGERVPLDQCSLRQAILAGLQRCNCTCQIAGFHDPDCAVYGPPPEPCDDGQPA